ncbi:MAG TPA: hypothetical protein DEB17_05490 [Chlorobaculum sp.]|uniref:Uncharacterized protein n=1 Tax=Chlorobaculum tepidum (strain ATCC 49652 / DSM 12025 / NBRC 103806 / TLS) TaxID=194439 RepID=Q8KAP8_CHLTE|nr:hypothetical protein CT2108 [Chlorobaculum tepidum TLS]HBU23439.1 hypothetical protein [Chlorobaculum sp.]
MCRLMTSIWQKNREPAPDVPRYARIIGTEPP